MAKGSWNEFNQPSTQVRSSSISNTYNKSDRAVRVKRTKIGKGGKIVTVITGLGEAPIEMRSLLKNLKSSCGTGGTLKGETLELQGDQVDAVLRFLESKGFRPKKSGG